MPNLLASLLSITGRVLLCAIFFLSAVGQKIPNFNETIAYMQGKVPSPAPMLVGAIVFLIVGSLSVVLGFKGRWGALLLAIFLALASYFFHNFWDLAGEARHMQQIQFMKNLSIFGALLFIVANGTGPGSLDCRCKACEPKPQV